MSGHSKWHNIQAKKGKADAAKGRIFTKLGREIAVAAKANPNPETNSKLADIIAKAKAANMPNDNIQRSIKKASGELSGADYKELTYEGYGVAGSAVIIATLTDNLNRTAGDVRAILGKHGGQMGQTGCVSYNFENKGYIVIERTVELDEDTITEIALEAGADDFNFDGDVFEIYTDANEVGKVAAELEAKGYTFLSAEAAYLPTTTTELTDDESVTKMEKLIDMLEENDDVQEVYHNWENADE